MILPLDDKEWTEDLLSLEYPIQNVISRFRLFGKEVDLAENIRMVELMILCRSL